MPKYPGANILFEFGTNKELAKSWGVSERTIYRWKNKAKTETGARSKKPTRPRLKTLQTFKGTRKELAKKYNVSERTAYRWLQQARNNGVDIESRRKPSKYPGAGILDETGKNKELAEKYGVSDSTIRRWKRRARSEIKGPETPLFGEQKPFEDLLNNGVSSVFDDFAKDFEEDFNSDFNITPDDDEPFEVTPPPEFSEKLTEQLNSICNLLYDADLLTENSAFHNLDDDMKLIYLNEYLQFQWEENPFQFNQSPPDDPNGPDLSDPEKIANINIWGDDFDNWLANQMDIDNT